MNRIGVNRFGFSLIEVTMAVVVAGILASMSVSTWR
ncbi:MAG: prepilin-type N-terminal cleavage/methylation domain-containing protein, partial [Chitinivibrionales bacterium]